VDFHAAYGHFKQTREICFDCLKAEFATNPYLAEELVAVEAIDNE
jgi:hypothetical protein